jgi:hypothetical protein
VVNGSGLVLVIFATVLVVILAKVDQQLTAATGILGAIAGYLFGKATKGSDTEQKPDKVITHWWHGFLIEVQRRTPERQRLR